MYTNLNELRKEAYSLWGVNYQRVIFNYPTSRISDTQEFLFKLDFADDKKAWPKAYAVATPNRPTDLRIIIPIIVQKQYHQFNLEVSSWYDMPRYLHEQLIKLSVEAKVERELPWWKKTANHFLTKSQRFDQVAPIEDYLYGVYNQNQSDDMIMQVF